MLNFLIFMPLACILLFFSVLSSLSPDLDKILLIPVITFIGAINMAHESFKEI